MTNDPYKVLGVSPDATDDEVKRAYRELARKYHPDNYNGNPLADLVEEKMKEINEAYDTIQKMRASGHGSSGSYGDTSSYGGSSDGTEGLARARTLINSGRFSEAELLIDAVPAAERGAEWNYLKGCLLTQRGWYFDAQKSFETACYMDPNNAEYRSALEKLRQNSSSFGRGYRTTPTRGGECSGCDMCSGLICADCCCESMGGDLIPCC